MGPLTASSYWSLVEERNAYRQTFWESLDGRHLDVILCPPASVPAVTHGATEHLFPAFIQAFTYNVLGAPAGVVTTTSVRRDEEAGRTEDGDDLAQEAARRVDQGSAGLPVGVQVVGRHWNDHIVLAVMAALERQARETSGYPKPENLVV